MKLYVCWGTFRPFVQAATVRERLQGAARRRPRSEVVRSYGLALLPDAIANRTSGREAARRLTGKSTVPVLELDDGTAIADSKRIVEWARANPA